MPTSCETAVNLPANVALHARPAGAFVRAASKFRARITVLAGGRSADAKSILALLALGAEGGTLLLLKAEGEDAREAVDDLAACIIKLSE